MTLATPRDYFTLAEFREFAGDAGPSYTYDEAKIARAAAVAINRLERWAETAFPNVAAPAGSGTILIADLEVLTVDEEWEDWRVGSEVVIPGAGAAGADLVATIVAFDPPASAPGTSVTITPAATLPVAGAALVWGDGWGTARVPRHAIDRADGASFIPLRFFPVIADSLVVTVDDYASTAFLEDLEAGEIHFASAPARGFRNIVAEYDFGETVTPIEVKEAVMAAVKSRLDVLGTGANGGSRIPSNVSRFITEDTTFEMDIRKTGAEPWPWDERASEEIEGIVGVDAGVSFL